MGSSGVAEPRTVVALWLWAASLLPDTSGKLLSARLATRVRSARSRRRSPIWTMMERWLTSLPLRPGRSVYSERSVEGGRTVAAAGGVPLFVAGRSVFWVPWVGSEARLGSL